MLALGCRPGRPRPAPASIPAALPDADELLASVVARRQALSGLRGIARIAYETGEERVAGRHAVVAAPPNRFRLEVLSPLGAVAVVTCDGAELAVWVRREHRTYRGPATPANVAAHTGVRVRVEDVVSMLLGLPPDRRPVAPPTLVSNDDAALIGVTADVTLDGEGAVGRQTIWFAADSRVPVASETTLAAGQVLHVDFADYRDVAGAPFPFTVEMRLDPDDRRVRVRYDGPTLGTSLDDALFSLPPRSGVEELRIDDYSETATE